MSIEQEFYNQLLPLGNSPATRGMVAIEVNPTGGVLNLNDVFGPTGGAGHFYEIKAIGVPSGSAVHLAAHMSPTYKVEPKNFAVGATGGGHTGIGWPLRDGQSVIGRMPMLKNEMSPTLAGYPTAGYRATMMPAPYIHYRATHLMPTGAALYIRQMTNTEGTNVADKHGFPAPY